MSREVLVVDVGVEFVDFVLRDVGFFRDQFNHHRLDGTRTHPVPVLVVPLVAEDVQVSVTWHIDR